MTYNPDAVVTAIRALSLPEAIVLAGLLAGSDSARLAFWVWMVLMVFFVTP